MPHLSNCEHQDSGWCLSCVKKLEEERFQLQVELDCVKNPVYCPTCGACGEAGCCPPSMCKHGFCLYGEHYAVEFEYYRALVNAMWDRMDKTDQEQLHKIHDRVWTNYFTKKEKQDEQLTLL